MSSDFPIRKNIRLKYYEYSQHGAYFVTICTQFRQCLFGDVVDGQMVLNDLGRIVESVWYGLPGHYSHIQLGQHVVMPNHFHGIIIMDELHGNLRDDCRDNLRDDCRDNLRDDCRDNLRDDCRDNLRDDCRDNLRDDCRAGLKPAPTNMQIHPNCRRGGFKTRPEPPEPRESQNLQKSSNKNKKHTLSEIVRALKTFSSRKINEFRKTVGHPVWQRNYYEHIIRNENDYERICDYIVLNPENWAEDAENPKFNSSTDTQS